MSNAILSRLENNLIDAEIHCSDLRAELAKILPDYREARRMVRIARTRLREFESQRAKATTRIIR
jgi:hypothetical protein